MKWNVSRHPFAHWSLYESFCEGANECKFILNSFYFHYIAQFNKITDRLFVGEAGRYVAVIPQK